MTTLRWGSASDTGRVRTLNEDSSLEAEPIFAVADGMGGHAGGDVASQVAVEALRVNATATHDGLVQGIRMANRAVLDRAEGDPRLRGMGTTLCAIALVGPDDDSDDERIVVANVGDSRVYLFQDGDLLQVTEDHSLVEEMVRQGRLTAEEARNHPQKNIVTRVLGSEADVEVDSWEITPHEGDRYLLCSDGLFGEVDDDRTAAVLRRIDDPGEAARELVRLALEAGGRDNVTVVVVDVVDDGGRAEAASAAVAGDETDATRAAPRRRDTGGVRALDLDNMPGGRASGGREGRPGEAGARHRRLTWRSALFVVAVVAVVGGAVGSVAWFARSTYYVALHDDEVVIFQGRPGGVLWLDPTLAERTGIPADEVPPARRSDVEAGKEQPSLEAARRYVANLEDQARATRTTTTTTTTSTTAATTTTTGAAP